MEATPPPADPPPADPRLAGAPPPGAPEKAGGGLRALGILGFLLLAFGAAVIAVTMADLGDGPLCDDVPGGAAHPLVDCWDVSSGGRVVALILGWPGALCAALAALAALAFTITGRNGRRFWVLTAAAVVLCGLSIAVAQIT
jgi:hypothetical protein